MNTPKKFRKTTHLITATLAVFALTSCNMLSFIDSPSGDAQLKDAARSCLDKADYDCALKYYQQLSNASIDVKISETSLTQLAKANIFKMSELFNSLGSGTGDSGSFAFLAETMSSKGTTTSANRLIIQQAFADTASIVDPTIQAYMQFISSLVMTNHLLASAVGADGKLTASDIVQNPTACIATNGICVDGSSPCDKPPGSSLDDTQAPDVTDLSTSSNWNTAPSITKIIKAADAANTASGTLFGGGTGGGLGSIFKDIIDNAGASECQKRYGIVFALFSGN